MDISEINKIREQNRLLNEQEIKEKKTFLKSKPQNILIFLNTTCNLKCIHCSERFFNKYIISDTLFDDIIQNMQFFKSFCCIGGEPLLYDKFGIIFDKAKEFQTNLNITTNGLLLDEQLIKKMEDMSIEINISVDGFDKQTYESIRKGASFDILKENLKILKYYKQQKGFEKLRYRLFMLPQKLNYTQISSAIDFANTYNFTGIKFLQIIEPAKKNTLNNNEYSIAEESESFLLNNIETSFIKEQILKCIERIDTEHLNLSIDTDIPINYKKSQKLQKFLIKDFKYICSIPWKTIAIQKFKQIALDCIPHFETNSIANTLEEAWNSQYIQDIRKGLIENNPISSCINCYKRKLFHDIKG